MDDQEAGDICDRTLEARVFASADERRVEAVALERAPDVRVAAPDLALGHCHDRSSPFTSASIAWFSGVGTPAARPKVTMPPFR